ncbi:hypothetical protein B0H14DRAFT_2758967 [Mycena olivaceomarginata]|nr:hypothetical protein B0H14DRAFT_2758967 [Mycena olivaceomarginata]
MHLVRSLWPVTLLCIAAVRGGFTNFTLDDTSPTITYTETPTARCSPGACDPDLTSRLHNGTSTITAGTIVVPFTGARRPLDRYPLIYCYHGDIKAVRLMCISGCSGTAFSISTGTMSARLAARMGATPTISSSCGRIPR